MQVRNQSYLRRKNKKSIIELLRKRAQSYSDLARELKLSNTAIANIVDDLIEQGVVYRENDAKGRGGIRLSINADFGYVIAVDFSRWEISFCAADFGSNILVRRKSEGISFHKGDIARIIGIVREIMAEDALKGRTLRCISIATPGKIDRESGKFILNPRFRELGSISLQTIFEEEFGCTVVVKNDINLALLGEKMYGALQDVENALMLHVDVGVGAALLIGGKVYEGAHGFAGEIGYFKLNMLLSDEDNYGNLSYANYFDSTSLFSSLGIVKREISLGMESILCDRIAERGGTWDDLTVSDLIDAYREKDPLAVRVIHSAARVIGTLAASLSELLDVEKIVLTGSVVGFGEEYLRNMARLTGDCPIVFSELEAKGIIMGAINAGIVAVFDDTLQQKRYDNENIDNNGNNI